MNTKLVLGIIGAGILLYVIYEFTKKDSKGGTSSSDTSDTANDSGTTGKPPVGSAERPIILMANGASRGASDPTIVIQAGQKFKRIAGRLIPYDMYLAGLTTA